MPSDDLSTYDGAMQFLVRVRLEPYWDTAEPNDRRVLFRKIAGKKGYYHVTRQRVEETWPTLITALGLRTQEDVARIRRLVRTRIEAK